MNKIGEFYDELDEQEQEYENQEYWEQQKNKEIERLQQRIDKAIEYINYMFDKANENDIIDDLLKIEKILKESEE
jgi:hypothetical protein